MKKISEKALTSYYKSVIIITQKAYCLFDDVIFEN